MPLNRSPFKIVGVTEVWWLGEVPTDQTTLEPF